MILLCCPTAKVSIYYNQELVNRIMNKELRGEARSKEVKGAFINI
jgi:hypothetical protein